MNAERLLQHYERIADAPDAIARLRRFILDLAVRGKLTSYQMQEGEVLLLGDLSEFIMGQAPPGNSYNEDGQGTVFVKVGEFGERFPVHAAWTTDPLKFAKQGDVLICVVGATIGKLNLAIDCAIGRSVAAIRPQARLDQVFLYYSLMPITMQLREDSRGTAQGVISRPDLAAITIWCPPLAEQRRIVAKVDELMGLCDRLEAARAGREATRDRLAAASLARLNAPDPETFLEDARFALHTLPALTTRPDQIKRLRQTILNLAVRGKVVPQDPNDEPASELLKRLHRERKHKRNFVHIDEDDLEAPLPGLPPQWLWTTTDQVSADDDNAVTDGPFGSQLKTDHYIDSPGFRVIRLQNIGSGAFREEHRSYVDQSRYERLSKHHVKAGDLVVAGLVDPNVRCCEVPADIGPALVKADCYRFAVHPKLSARYALHYLNSPHAQGFAAAHHHGMTLTRIGLGNFRRIPFPLPPLAEQHRIVAKVDALMALCDRLEASLTATAATRRRLLDALLTEALAPVGDFSDDSIETINQVLHA